MGTAGWSGGKLQIGQVRHGACANGGAGASHSVRVLGRFPQDSSRQALEFPPNVPGIQPTLALSSPRYFGCMSGALTSLSFPKVATLMSSHGNGSVLAPLPSRLKIDAK